jgi:uncharacterized protein (TIRG00374 family)
MSRDWRFWLGILVGLVCIVWLALTVEWADVLTALKEMDYRWVLVATALNLVSVPLRAVRWRLMFRTYQAPPLPRLVQAMLIGQAVNVLAPARLGDFVRATLVGVGRVTYALGTLMVEVSLDLLMLAALVVLLLTQVSLPAWWRGSGEALLLTAAGALAVVTLLVIGRRWLAQTLGRLQTRWRRQWINRLLSGAAQAVHALDVLGGPTLLAAIGCSALIWIAYTSVNFVLLKAIVEGPSLLAALFLLAVLQLGVAVPSSPGRIGVYHYLCIQALAVFGIGDARGLSYAFVLHLISVVMPLCLGGLLAWQLGVSLYPRSREMEY